MSIDNLMSWEEIRDYLTKKHKGRMWSKYQQVVDVFQDNARHYRSLGYGPVDSAKKSQIKTQEFLLK